MIPWSKRFRYFPDDTLKSLEIKELLHFKRFSIDLLILSAFAGGTTSVE